MMTKQPHALIHLSMFGECAVALFKLPVADLPFARVMEAAIWLPAVEVSVLLP